MVYTPSNGVAIIGVDYGSRKPSLFERFLWNFDMLPSLTNCHFVFHQVCEACNQTAFGAVITEKAADETTKEAFREQVNRMIAIAAEGFILRGDKGQKLVFRTADLLFHPGSFVGLF